MKRRDGRGASKPGQRPQPPGARVQAPRHCCRTYCPDCPWTIAQLARERGQTPPRSRKRR